MSLQTYTALEPALPEALDVLRFPLYGSRLIEASAGTGKTYTIAALYVRLVLGHGQAQAYARALTPPEILVVTFTDAATQELRDRIRQRLAEAAAYFLADPQTVGDLPPGQDLLHDIRAEYPGAAWAACARKLQLAAEWMDEAAVSTIHAWCNRMLREHAFDSDSLFTQALEADQSELLGEAVRDYWRCFMVSLDALAVAEVAPWWSGPDALYGDVRALLEHAGQLAVGDEPAVVLGRARDERLRCLAALKAPWALWADELQGLLDDAVAGKRVNGRKLQARYYRAWLDALRDWATDPLARRPELNTGWTRLTDAGLREVWTQGEPPRHPALAAIEGLPQAIASLPEARDDVLCHAVRWVAERFAGEQARHAQIGFNDLLTRLNAALDGVNGRRLAELIRRQFPVALIDEFQDTDPVQYRIFDAVYPVEQNDAATALILIGDPKQAIYAFRGADIHTYLTARRACAGRLYTLKKNFRSTAAMVAASNRCFAAAEERAQGDGAFLFRRANENPLPFVAADAEGRRDALIVAGAPSPALNVWQLPSDDPGKPLAKERYLALMAQSCASEMVRLLNLAAAGQAGFSSGDALRALRPADLAVLVNNRSEAQAIRSALAERGVRSVYLSDKDSVFACAQAVDLQHWLAACAEPDDGRLLRAALATATLALSYAELEQLNHDESAWDARVLQFRAYRDCWQRQGVLPMLRRLLNDFGVPQRLLASTAGEGSTATTGGERMLTDLLHLAELMQQASGELDGEHALIRHLAEQRGGAGASGDAAARQIRLESDADLVQVVTVHKSKGLEYPLVFLPFACAARPLKADDLPLKYHDEEDRLRLVLSAADGVLERADRERLGEDLRKLYVALTRARYATWVGLAPLAALERCAFGYLLGGGEPLPANGLAAALEAWRGDCAQIALSAAPAASGERLRASTAPAASGAARRAARRLAEHWWVASYSALKAATADAREEGAPGGALAVGAATADGVAAGAFAQAADSAADERFGELRAAARALAASADAETVSAPSASAPGSLHALPHGAEVGSFLHDLLEAAARAGFATLAGDARRLGELVDRRCALRGWPQLRAPLTAWLGDFLRTPLPLPALAGEAASTFSFCGLTSSLAEMEFWLATRKVDIAAIDRLIVAHTLASAPRPPLAAGRLNGMLKGFIDLVFEHRGRYYVADYKSNWLGPNDVAYAPPALRAAILEARYDLQYVLYLLALHRQLKSRLAAYDYDRHIGGAVYIFLRGGQAPGQGIHAERPPRELIEALDRLFSAGSANAPGAAGQGTI